MIALNLHFSKQSPHPMHLCSKILCFCLISPSIASTGQTLLHAVHPMQFSGSISAILYSFNSLLIALVGHFNAHIPQLIHFSWSILAKFPLISIALTGHDLAQRPQAIHAILQFDFAICA